LSKRSCLGAIWFSLAGIIPAGASAGDAVVAMCMERDEEAVCNCASEALLEQIGEEDYAIYEAIGEDYLARLEAGEGRVDAWMAASRTEAGKRGLGNVALMGRTNEIGNVHRAAIKDCGG
jgi:hypothetical protein